MYGIVGHSCYGHIGPGSGGAGADGGELRAKPATTGHCMAHTSPVTCHTSPVTRHLSPVTHAICHPRPSSLIHHTCQLYTHIL